MSVFFLRFLKLIKRQPSEEKEHIININDTNEKRYSNAVITSKYTVFNFLFLNLYEQFHKISNIYFLFIGVLQTTPHFSSTNGIPTVAIPLSIVLIANAIKDAYEDWKRHVSDKVENNKLCYVIENIDVTDANNESSSGKGFFEKIKNVFKKKPKAVIDADENKTKIDAINNTSDNNDVEYDDYLNEDGCSGYARDVDNFYNYDETEKCEVIEGTVQKQWKNIKVGDIILSNKSDFFCADILLLGCSDKNGIAFVETSSLDGETNLKMKQTNGHIFNMLGYDRAKAIERVKKLKGYIISDAPNKDLSIMHGTICLLEQAEAKNDMLQLNENFLRGNDMQNSERNSIKNNGIHSAEDVMRISLSGKKTEESKWKRRKKTLRLTHLNLQSSVRYHRIPFDAKQFLLRGCKLKNTEWIIGIVIYTGKETKIQMNSTKSIRKTSKLERLTNRTTIIIWVIQMVICLISAIYSVVIVNDSRIDNFSYLPFALEEKRSPVIVGIISFFSWVVITGNFVPISLVVTMSFVKVIQAYFISSDETMIHKVCLSPDGDGICEESANADIEKTTMTKPNTMNRGAEHYFPYNKDVSINIISNLKKKEEDTKEGRGTILKKEVVIKNYKKEEINSLKSGNIELLDEKHAEKKKEQIHGQQLHKRRGHSVSFVSYMDKRRESLLSSFNECKERNYIYFNAVPRTSSLIEELGQIEYIFSDKTGTLTCNFMEFRKCAINGISYGKGLTEIKRNILKKQNMKVPKEPVLRNQAKTPHVNFVDDDLVNHLKNANHFNHAHLIYFFIHLAINHAVICEKNEKGEDIFAASSPDEEALVYAAKHVGIQFLYRRDGKYGIKIFDKVYEIETLAAIEFTSQRKMSSIICRIPCACASKENIKGFFGDNIECPTITKSIKNPPVIGMDIKENSTWNIMKDAIKTNDEYSALQKYNNEVLRENEESKNPNMKNSVNGKGGSTMNNIPFDKQKKNRKQSIKKNNDDLKKGKKKKNHKIGIDGDNPLIENMNSKWKIKKPQEQTDDVDVECKSAGFQRQKQKHENPLHSRDKDDISDYSANKYKDSNFERKITPVCNCSNTHSKIMLFSKGAGSVILKKLEKFTEVDQLTVKHMETYADEGLRTLCIAKKEITEEEFSKWYELYKNAICSVKDRDQQIEKVADIIENNLTLQGVTGIEDKLQEGVSSTIEDLRIAGIHIWMLTGDKIETAINIGIAANLIDYYAEQFIYTEDLILDEQKLMDKLNEDVLKVEKALHIPHYEFETSDIDEKETDKNSKTEIEKGKIDENGKKQTELKTEAEEKENMIFPKKTCRRKSFNFGKKKKALSLDRDKFTSLINYTNHVLIVDGTVIDILLTEKFEKRFFYLADKCTSVICGRISPYQKGAIVSAANRLLKKITLAIGDGANDRNMITQANIGIGIKGLEGVQAFNASDYGIGQFRFLKTLLLVHGRLSYRRISKLVVYMFYKNIVLIMPLFFFGGISLYSGQKIYYEFMMQSYNVFFTSIPVIVFAVLDQDIDKHLSLMRPALYRLGIYHYYFNIKIFVAWVFNSVFHASVVFLLPLYFLSYYNIPTTDGKPYDIWDVGSAIFFLTVLIVNLKMLLESYFLNALPIIGVALSILCFIILLVAFSFMSLGSGQILGTVVYLSTSLRFWLVVLLGVMLALTRDYIFKVYKRNFNPEIYHLMQKESDETLDTLLHERTNCVNPEKTVSERMKTFGYAFSEADPACIDIIRKQDKMI